MKFLKSILFIVLALTSLFKNVNAQMVGTDCFLMGDNIEMGIHTLGYPGSASLPPFPTHWSGGPSRLCYVANPDESPVWGDYDGGFYMPGSPENRFGIEIDGVTSWNSWFNSICGSSNCNLP